MSPNHSNTQSEHLLHEAWEDFILSRKAMLCSPNTIEFYRYTAKFFIDWLGDNDEPESRHVHAYLNELANRKLADTTVHCHARSIKTFLKFCFSEGYLPELITFQMPRVAKKRLPVLSTDDVQVVLAACQSIRNKTIVMLLLDTGLRRSEVCSLNWGDIDLSNGLVLVNKGKGGKARSVVVGIQTRRALLQYRRSVPHTPDDPVFVTSTNSRLRSSGLRMALRRIGDRVGTKLTTTILRRTFASFSLRAGINPIYLQALMGHASLEMTKHYISITDDDLLHAHQDFGPIDTYVSR